MDFFSFLFNAEAVIKTAGYLGIFGIIFTESGFLIGFFLPGDSLLFTAGFLASQDYLNITILALGSFISAVAGDSFGYALGHRFGHRVFTRNDSLFFHKDHLRRAEEFYKKYGGKTIILARFVPVVRSVAPILAGAGKMHYTTFIFYNIFGGFFWAVGLTTLGYFLGSAIPDIDRYLLPIVAGIIAVSLLPGVISFLRNPQLRARAVLSIKQLLNRRKK
ncbi:MAG: VTT domain-containing protein [Candidatus Sungbacteria bacterium]|nr:VTT domain-containing protein [Candidatus Sungbacteria bacterium]